MNVLQYAAQNQANFKAYMAENGHEIQSTFYQDLSVAEFISGINGVKETYNRVVKEWKDNVKYFTEFVMSLNLKIWQHYKKNRPLALCYNELWEKADELARTTFKGKDLEYYFATTD